jgi:hypothetical protein
MRVAMDVVQHYLRADADRHGAVAYSFCTLVTNLTRYHAMVEGFRRLGFTSADREFLYIDNSASNQADAFSGYNRFLRQASGRYVILCHQDVMGLEDGREKLDSLLAALSEKDSVWAVCGNAGVDVRGRRFIRITDPYAPDQSTGQPFPRKVMSLDENFIVVKSEANLALSRDLTGFHWYGSDLCLIADILGWTAYVIDFHLRHDSRGSVDQHYNSLRNQLRSKYTRAFRPRTLRVLTERNVYLSGNRWVSAGANAAIDVSIYLYAQFKRRVLARLRN